MKLPNCEKAVVEAAKARDYLLSVEHPVGRSKAHFFIRAGFSRNDWQRLATELIELAQNGEAELGAATRFGQKYVVRGRIKSPSGRTVFVESAWIILNSDDVPRLVTAYPGARG